MKFFFLLCGLVLVASIPPSFAQQLAKRISIEKGQTSVVASGRLKNMRDSATYLISAKTGQKMVVRVSAEGGSARIGIVSPSNQPVGGGPGGDEIEALPESGDYRIEVVESPMGEEYDSSFTLEIHLF